MLLRLRTVRNAATVRTARQIQYLESYQSFLEDITLQKLVC